MVSPVWAEDLTYSLYFHSKTYDEFGKHFYIWSIKFGEYYNLDILQIPRQVQTTEYTIY